jgi:hypothetical protein
VEKEVIRGTGSRRRYVPIKSCETFTHQQSIISRRYESSLDTTVKMPKLAQKTALLCKTTFRPIKLFLYMTLKHVGERDLAPLILNHNTRQR